MYHCFCSPGWKEILLHKTHLFCHLRTEDRAVITGFDTLPSTDSAANNYTFMPPAAAERRVISIHQQRCSWPPDEGKPNILLLALFLAFKVFFCVYQLPANSASLMLPQLPAAKQGRREQISQDRKPPKNGHTELKSFMEGGNVG